MTSDDRLLVAWKDTLALRGDLPAIFNTAGEVLRTFRGIEEHARWFAAKIDIFHAGDVVAVGIGNHEDWPPILIACLRKRIVVLPLEHSINDRQRDAALNLWGTRGVITHAPGRGGSPEPPALRTWQAPGRAIEVNRPYHLASMLKATSGTTATPRLVRFRSEQLFADCNQICDTMGISDVDLNFSVIPISHSYGFSNLLLPLIVRGVPMVVSRDRTPRAILADLARTNATVFPGMPLFYHAFCEMSDVPALPELRLCISAGAPLPLAVAKKFREKFKLPIHSFYGASECGGICYDRDGNSEIEGFVGQPMIGVELEVIDPEASSSQVRVHSAAVGDGYFPDPDEQKLGDGTFVPDDVLAREGSGFRIVGRISDVINVAGKKVNPAEVEAQLLRFRGVRQAVVFGRSSALRNEEVAACVVADVDLREEDLLELCRRSLSAWQVPKRVFIVESLPVNERGKISRRELGTRFAA